MIQLWIVALSVGGIGAISAFVFLSLYKGWLKLAIFRALTRTQTFHLMVIFLVLTFLFCTLALAGFLLRQNFPGHATAFPPLTIESLKNASYEFEGEVVTLKDGARTFQSPFKDGYVNVRLIEWAFGDIDGDRNQDVVVVLAADWGGSGTFMYLIPVINQSGTPSTLNSSFLIGDRKYFRSVIIRNQIVAVQYLTQGPNDGLCCPSVLTTISLQFDGDGLKCMDQQCPPGMAEP